MTPIVTRVGKARKRYRCDWECGSPIEPGQAHVRWAAPPHTEPHYGPGWWYGRAHGQTPDACPTFVYGTPHPAMEAAEFQPIR